jgi:hypothetical protein
MGDPADPLLRQLHITIPMLTLMLAFIGIGGETFKKVPTDATRPDAPKKHWLRRITRRGWMAVACYLLVFGFTIAEDTLEVQRAGRYSQQDAADRQEVAEARKLDHNMMQQLFTLTIEFETAARGQLGSLAKTMDRVIAVVERPRRAPATATAPATVTAPATAQPLEQRLDQLAKQRDQLHQEWKQQQAQQQAHEARREAQRPRTRL